MSASRPPDSKPHTDETVLTSQPQHAHTLGESAVAILGKAADRQQQEGNDAHGCDHDLLVEEHPHDPCSQTSAYTNTHTPKSGYSWTETRHKKQRGNTVLANPPPPNLPHGIMLQGHTAPANMHTDAMKHTAVLFYSDGTQGG